jgi:hypothetical protein
VQRTKVFVSYSRHDEALVRPLAGLLGVATDDAVFLDVASIRPGDNWKDDIDGALRESSVFVICWCCQAEKSEFIAHEIAAALEKNDKRLVPVLFCDTPLPRTLAAYQWIDLRGQITHSCAHITQHTPLPMQMDAPFPRARGGKRHWALMAGIAAVLLIATGLVTLRLKKGVLPPAQVSQVSGNDQAPLNSNEIPHAPSETGARVVVVDRDLRLTDIEGKACQVSTGDVLLLPKAPTTDSKSAIVEVIASKSPQECRKGMHFSVSLEALQKMEDHMRETIDQRLADLKRQQRRKHIIEIVSVWVVTIVLAISMGWVCWFASKSKRRRKTDKIVAAARAYFGQLGKTHPG